MSEFSLLKVAHMATFCRGQRRVMRPLSKGSNRRARVWTSNTEHSGDSLGTNQLNLDSNAVYRSQWEKCLSVLHSGTARWSVHNGARFKDSLSCDKLNRARLRFWAEQTWLVYTTLQLHNTSLQEGYNRLDESGNRPRHIKHLPACANLQQSI